MAIPTYVGVGATTVSATLVSLTPGLPSYAEDDILILHLQTAANGHHMIAPPSGWTLLDQIGLSGTGGTDITDTLWWKRASASETAPTIDGGFSYNLAKISSFRGCAATGSPFNVWGWGHRVTNDTAFGPALAVTTTDDDCLIALFGGTSDDNTISSIANSSLSSVTEQYDVNTLEGYDGMIFMATGGLASAGSSGTWTGTCTKTEKNAWIVLALTPTVASDGGAAFNLIPGVFSA